MCTDRPKNTLRKPRAARAWTEAQEVCSSSGTLARSVFRDTVNCAHSAACVMLTNAASVMIAKKIYERLLVKSGVSSKILGVHF